VRPLQVDLQLELDPASGPSFAGSVVHQLRIDRSRRSITLHSADLRVSGARLEAGDLQQRGRIEAHPEQETLEIHFPRPIPPGEARLALSFRGRLRGDLRGLYAARGGDDAYAFTQLEAADARRVFPCFDEPDKKARFRISVTTAARHTVLSNQPVEKIEPLEAGRKIVHFERTPPLSTYLLALAVGPLVASEPTHLGETEIRVWHVPGKERLTDFGLETARETLERLQAYFDLPYPYAKLDLVAVPDFEAGAMENAGAVFFRETLLLVDPETATLQEKKRAAEVICHELAHMWYGDLVTMAWWDDLWLNEAFATWMAFQVVDAWKPEWRMWNDFQHYRAAALGLDALEQTHPIYTKVRSPAEATENFDLITYEKGASVVRMIERYLGAETFRTGVRNYIRAHQESNTVAADLWRALSEASGQDVEAIARAWIEQPGFPLLRLRRGRRQGKPILRYSQERFFANPKAAAKPRYADSRWPIPWIGRLGRSARGDALARQLLQRQRASSGRSTRRRSWPRFGTRSTSSARWSAWDCSGTSGLRFAPDWRPHRASWIWPWPSARSGIRTCCSRCADPWASSCDRCDAAWERRRPSSSRTGSATPSEIPSARQASMRPRGSRTRTDCDAAPCWAWWARSPGSRRRWRKPAAAVMPTWPIPTAWSPTWRIR
jgi:puromycin-sensitive aminopeptidase